MASAPDDERVRGAVLVIHGGAGAAPATSEARRAAEVALASALANGWAVLSAGGAAIDAVEVAVASLEESGCFNAGAGAVADADGGVTLDAAVMDGARRTVGAVAAVTNVRAAVRAARLVMDETSHVLLAGAGAERFAAEHGVALAPAGYFQKMRQRPVSNAGTVGAVARDVAGHLAAATATGGVSGKLPGRVGDSPLAGAGVWADARCAVSATGTGEFFIRAAFAHRIACEMELAGRSLEDAADRALVEVTSLGGTGGCIAVDRQGRVAMPLSTPAMYRGVVDAGGTRVAVLAEDALRSPE